jgi:RHS repeat-associated protein
MIKTLFPFITLYPYTRTRAKRLLGVLALSVSSLSQAASPQITGIPELSATVGTVYTYDLRATDADNDSLRYSLSTWPAGLGASISAQGVITWSLDSHHDAGQYTIDARVYDDHQGVDHIRYTLTVTDPNNHAPVINNTPVLEATVGTTYTSDLQATDADNDPLHYKVSTWPSGLNVTISDQGVITWPLDDHHDAGQYAIFVRVDDGNLGVDKLTYWLTVTDPNNHAPVITNSPVLEATVGTTYTYDLQATDGDNDPLRYKVSTWPSGLDVHISAQGVITWEVDAHQDAGQYVIIASVDDGNLGVDKRTYWLTVSDPNNHPPVINNPPVLNATVGTVYTYDLQASDGDNDPLQYKVSTWPTGLDVTISAQGLVSWNLDSRDDAGQYVIIASVNDGNLGVDYVRYHLSVIDPSNQAPKINSTPVLEASAGTTYTYPLQVTDGNNDPLTYKVSTWPSGLGVTISDQGIISWPLTAEQAPGHYVIIAHVDDGHQGKAEQRYTLTVTPSLISDTDGDGIADTEDAFPNDPLQSQDTDGNGIGDNTVVSQAVAYTYNDQGQILSIDGPRTDINDITTYTYDVNGNRTQITNALGHTIQLSDHNGRGQPQQIIAANGAITTLTYHIRGWLLSTSVQKDVASTALSTTTYAYDNTGKVTQITRPDGVVLYYHYDTSNRLIGVSNNAGERIDYTLDKAGNRIAQTIQDGSSTITYRMQQAFDELSRVMDIIGAENQTTQINYDVNDNAVETINPRQYASQHQYDPLDRLSQTTDAENGTTQFTYDAQDRLTSVTDANGNTTTYQYNAFDHLIQQDSPDTGISRYAYDNAGNRVVSVDSRGIVTRYTYDALNRITHLSYPTSPEENITYSYDATTFTDNTGQLHPLNAIGRLYRIQDHSGEQFYAYDDRGNISSHIRLVGPSANPAVYWTDYIYDLANKLIEIQVFLPNGNLSYAATYRYDTLGRVNSVSYQRANSLDQAIVDNILYLPFGPVSRMDYSNGISADYHYDQDYRLIGLQTQTDNAMLLARNYTYDPNGNISQIDQLETPTQTRDFSYDPLDRLSRSDSTSTSTTWTYDSVGNRLRENTDDYGYFLSSNILSDILKTDSSTNYSVDNRGNTTQSTQGSSVTRFTYNAANRPDSVTHNGVTTEYRYNALGQRVRKTQGATTTHYLYNLQGQLMGEYTASGQPLVEYLYLHNQPLAQIRNQAVYYYHNDHLGTPQKLTDKDQNVIWAASYSAFGNATLTTEGVENNLRFAGQYFDSETGLHYNYFRYYDPQTGRYTQSDPIGLGGGINTYSYVLNNPLINIDPLGKKTCRVIDSEGNISCTDHDPWGRWCHEGGCASGLPPNPPPASPQSQCNFECNIKPQIVCTGIGLGAGALAAGGCIVVKALVCALVCSGDDGEPEACNKPKE